jgi:hypothetical protein
VAFDAEMENLYVISFGQLFRSGHAIFRSSKAFSASSSSKHRSSLAKDIFADDHQIALDDGRMSGSDLTAAHAHDFGSRRRKVGVFHNGKFTARRHDGGNTKRIVLNSWGMVRRKARIFSLPSAIPSRMTILKSNDRNPDNTGLLRLDNMSKTVFYLLDGSWSIDGR